MGRTEEREGRRFASWQITRRCNYRCHYCRCDGSADHSSPLPVRKIVDTFRATGFRWCLGITGGEPLLLPHFARTCASLVREGIHVSIDTNLSVTAKVREFAELVDPSGVEYVYISAHIEEREKRGEVENLVENVGIFKGKGFKCTVNYVLHPSLFGRFVKDRDYFHERGITLKAKPFKGLHGGKLYPGAYSREERALILESNPRAYSKLPFRSKGTRCSAGRTMVRVNEEGIITRCKDDPSVLGSIMGGLTLNAGDEPCRVDSCFCFGYRLIKDEGHKKAVKNAFIPDEPEDAIPVNTSPGDE